MSITGVSAVDRTAAAATAAADRSEFADNRIDVGEIWTAVPDPGTWIAVGGLPSISNSSSSIDVA